MPILVYTYEIVDTVLVSTGTIELPDSVDADGDGDISEAEWDAYVTGGRQLSAHYNVDGLMALWEADNNASQNGDQHNGIFYSMTGGLSEEEVLAVIQQLEDGNNVGIGDDFVYCFAEGSRLRTPGGETRVERLSVGDMVDTLDHGPQAIRWIGRSDVAATGDLCPIRIRAGALGDGLPSSDLLVSPHHRMVVTGWRAEVLFGEPEVLVAARDLVNDETIRPATDLDTVTYFHILFDRHEIVFGNGAPSESFHPAEAALNSAEQAVRDEIFRLFPELRDNLRGYGETARMVVGPRDARMIMGAAPQARRQVA